MSCGRAGSPTRYSTISIRNWNGLGVADKGAIGLRAAAPMAAVCPAAPIPLDQIPAVHGIPLGVPPHLEQILDLEVKAAQVEQVDKLCPHPIVLVC